MDAQYWINKLGLVAHQDEVGYFKEIYRCEEQASGLPERYEGGSRKFGTHVYFLQQPNDPVFFRVLKSDESWHFYAGEPLIIYVLNGETGDLQQIGLGPQEDNHFYYTIPHGHYYAVRLKDPKPNSYCLVGISSCPGFERSDVSFGNHEELARKFPQHKNLFKGMKRIGD